MRSFNRSIQSLQEVLQNLATTFFYQGSYEGSHAYVLGLVNAWVFFWHLGPCMKITKLLSRPCVM